MPFKTFVCVPMQTLLLLFVASVVLGTVHCHHGTGWGPLPAWSQDGCPQLTLQEDGKGPG